MKKLFLTLTVILTSTIGAKAQNANNFKVEKFEKLLIKEMYQQFPGMTLDTTLNFAARATSQAEAGYPDCYGTKKGGMVNTANEEKAEAVKLVAAYKEYLKNVLYFDDAALIRCNFTEFCATATKENGMVRYGLIVDNNFSSNLSPGN
jgi:arginine deiminase